MRKIPQEARRSHYIHRMSYTLQERIVGIFVLVGISLLVAMIFVTGKTQHLFEEKIQYYGMLKTAEGVSRGTVVRISGIEVGEVTSIDISEFNEIIITLEVLSRFKTLMRKDSIAKLGKLSLLGQASIEISAGSIDAPLLASGAIMQIEESPSIDEVIARATPILETVLDTIQNISNIVSAVKPDEVGFAISNISRLSKNLEEVSVKINKREGLLGTVLTDKDFDTDVRKSVENLKLVLEETHKRLTELEPFIQNANTFTGKANVVMEHLPKLVEGLKKATRQVNELLETIKTEPNQTPDLLLKVKTMMDELDKTLKGVQRIWPLSRTIDSNEFESDLIAPQGVHQ